MRKLVLKHNLALGDVVVLTAAVRDLHRCYPGQFLTDVRTSGSELWCHNPLLAPLDENDPDVECLDCEYPLIQWCNQVPCHMVYGFADFLNQKLGLEIKPTELRGDIHLSPAERASRPALQGLLGMDAPYWLVVAGGKHDVTIKWWDPERYQEVVDQLRGRVQFVQVGGAGDFHPKLRGAVDLRGKTSVRDLVRLVYHAQGVLCGVTGLMHLAAAVPGREGGALRPCVVVAGGREPVHWEAYPGHQFIHTIGALPCCASGGCWKSRTVPLGDDEQRDAPQNLCSNLSGSLPRCMDMISAREVVRRIEVYFKGGALPWLNRKQARASIRAVAATRENAAEAPPLQPASARSQLEWFLRQLPAWPDASRGYGIVMCLAEPPQAAAAWLNVRLLRHLGCHLPVQWWFASRQGLTDGQRQSLTAIGVELVEAERVAVQHTVRRLAARELKLFALRHTRYRHALLVDPSALPEMDPTHLFAAPEYRQHGAVFWRGAEAQRASAQAWRFGGLEPESRAAPLDTAVMLVDRRRCWPAVALAAWMNENADFFFAHTGGEPGVCQIAWRKTGGGLAMPARGGRDKKRLRDFIGQVVFFRPREMRRTLSISTPRLTGFRHQKIAARFLDELPDCWRNPAPFLQSSQQPLIGSSGPKQAPDVACIAEEPPSLRRIGESLTLVTLYDSAMARVGRRTSEVLRDYARRHGYACRVHEQALDTTRHPAWSKLLAVQAVLAEKPGAWVMWIDADAVVVNHRFRAETLVPKGFEAVFASDFNGLNSGIFLIHSSEWSRRFLETVFSLGDLHHAPDGFGPKWDQNTFKHVLQNFAGFADQVVLLPQNRMNSSLDTYVPGDFILHLGTMPNGERLRHLRSIKKWTVK